MQTMNVSLTPELIQIIQNKVESGLYGNASEVIRDAIRQMEMYEQLAYELKLEQLKKKLAPGIADVKAGRFADYSLEKLNREIDEEFGIEREPT